MPSTRCKKITGNGLFKLILQEVRQQGWRYGLYLAVIALFAVITVLPPKFYAFYVENVAALQTMTSLSAYAFIKQLMIFGTLIAAVMFIGNLIRILCEEWVCLRIEGSLRYRFMDHSQKLPFENLDGAQRGEWLTRMSRDIRVVEQFITTTLPQQMQDLVIVLAIGGIFIHQNGALAVFMLASSAIIATYNFMVQRRLNPIIDHLREMHGQVFQTMLENFEGMRTIRSFRIEAYVLKKFDDRVNAIIRKGMRAVRWVSLMVGSNSFAVNLLTASILSIVGWMLRQDKLTVSDVFSYPFYIGMFYGSVFALVRSIHDWNDFMVHGKRLMELIDESPSGGAANAAEHSAEHSAEHAPMGAQALAQGRAAKARMLLPTYTACLELSKAVVAYKDAPPLTRPFDFRMSLGETILIRGASGCGKSTFLEALAGLRSFAVQEINCYGKEQKRLAQFVPPGEAYLPLGLATFIEQRPFLFEGSLRENIALDKQASTSDADLWRALTEAHIAPMAKGRGGLDFIIRDDGGNLSEGQKHRISLARGLLHRRSFFLLDEPFAALDDESVAQICTTLNHLRPSHGIVIVSHVHPRGLDVDRVVDFDEFLAPFMRDADEFGYEYGNEYNNDYNNDYNNVYEGAALGAAPGDVARAGGEPKRSPSDVDLPPVVAPQIRVVGGDPMGVS